MKFILTFCHENLQTLHSCLDWNNEFNLNMQDGLLIQAKTNTDLEVCGQIALELKTDAWVYCFVIKPGFRGIGLGSALLTRAEQYIKDKGYKEVFLHVQHEFEKTLLPFYEKRGYEKQFKDGYIDEWVMKKIL